jgi:uncharacterized protein
MTLAMRNLIIILAFIAAGCSSKVNTPQPSTLNVCIRKGCVTAEIASDDAARERGLMYRDSLPADRGMLFIFDSDGRYSFWMKNTKMPLDIIWINPAMRVAGVSADVQPCGDGDCPSIMSETEIRYVLEVNAGFAKKYGIIRNDKVSFR